MNKERTLVECVNKEKNLASCNCTYHPCSRKGICCECLRYHLAQEELPGCCFPEDAQKSYDRSIANFLRWQAKR